MSKLMNVEDGHLGTFFGQAIWYAYWAYKQLRTLYENRTFTLMVIHAHIHAHNHTHTYSLATKHT
jgi:hypothetical protein